MVRPSRRTNLAIVSEIPLDVAVPAVREIGVTPYKGTRLHHPAYVELGSHGAIDDRRFFVVDADGRRLEAGAAALSLLHAEWDRDAHRLSIGFPDNRSVGDVIDIGEAIKALVPDTGGWVSAGV